MDGAPYRDMALIAPNPPPTSHKPLLWDFRVWWASRHFKESFGGSWDVSYKDIQWDTQAHTFWVPSKHLEDFISRCEATEPGKPVVLTYTMLGNKESKGFHVVHPLMVPTFATRGRLILDAFPSANSK